MKILNFGSLNLDYVYTVPHIPVPGETVAAKGLGVFCGGKGLNQSVALARAGAAVYHAGMVGEDGAALTDLLRQSGADTSLVKTVAGKSGHTVISVDKAGQNCILLYGGANRALTPAFIESVFGGFCAGDLLLLQNEVNGADRMIAIASEKGMQIALNPSPFDGSIAACDLSKVTYLLINEIEGGQITGQSEPDAILGTLLQRYPAMTVVLTLGKDGAVCKNADGTLRHPAFPVKAVDTTGAGDTFTGFFLACLCAGGSLEAALETASKAAAIAVTRSGAAPSIPTMDEVRGFRF